MHHVSHRFWSILLGMSRTNFSECDKFCTKLHEVALFLKERILKFWRTESAGGQTIFKNDLPNFQGLGGTFSKISVPGGAAKAILIRGLHGGVAFLLLRLAAAHPIPRRFCSERRLAQANLPNLPDLTNVANIVSFFINLGPCSAVSPAMLQVLIVESFGCDNV